MAATTWNASDIAGGTLSNGNLTFTTSGVNNGTRSVANFTTGQYYYELTITTLFGGVGIGFGLSTSAFGLTGNVGQAMVVANGNININNVATGSTLGSLGNGQIIGMAVDFGAKLVWFRKTPSGNWNGSGTANPATATGGLSTSAISGALYGMISSTSNVCVYTANFGAAAFNGVVPNGFTQGLGSGLPVQGGGAAQARAMVLA